MDRLERPLPQATDAPPPGRTGPVRTTAYDPSAIQGLGGAAALAALFEHRPEAFLRRVPGRETFVFDGPGGSAVVKRQVGLDRREWWHERLHRLSVRSAGRIEADNLAELVAAGFPAPRPHALLESGRASVLVMERVEHETDLASALAAESARHVERLTELAQLVARLHVAGFYHRDLYLQHVVLRRASGELVLLDCGRARRETAPRERWFVKDLAALAHSWPANLGGDAWLEFLARYRERRGAGPELADLTRWVDAKRARLAAHAPKFVDPAGGGRSRA
ncbi:MAG: lipopolysaccharide kinase InaA family protein [Planctomycetes bacterium]|nr:lipopolysaccharide kinase InaA family protein [Planctomycetota bacterium]